MGRGHDGFTRRLQFCIEKAGSLYRFAQLTGIAKGSVKGYLAGADPGRAKIIQISRALNVSASWLAFGVGFLDDEGVNVWTQIPIIRPEASPPRNEFAEVPAVIAVRTDHLPEMFRNSDPNNLAMVQVADRAMSKNLNYDEWVVIDRTRSNPEQSGIYCILVGGALKIRHVFATGLGRYSTRADQDEPDIKFSRKLLGDEVVVVGRVVTALRRVEGSLVSNKTARRKESNRRLED